MGSNDRAGRQLGPPRHGLRQPHADRQRATPIKPTRSTPYLALLLRATRWQSGSRDGTEVPSSSCHRHHASQHLTQSTPLQLNARVSYNRMQCNASEYSIHPSFRRSPDHIANSSTPPPSATHKPTPQPPSTSALQASAFTGASNLRCPSRGSGGLEEDDQEEVGRVGGWKVGRVGWRRDWRGGGWVGEERGWPVWRDQRRTLSRLESAPDERDGWLGV